MKKFIIYIFLTILLTFILIFSTVLSILLFPKNTFHSSYQSLIQDKYNLLIHTNEPKIIIVAGSSSAFGIDQYLLEKETGYKVVNLGLHAGFGHLFYSELSKANINPGDIVLLGYEYTWHSGFEYLDLNLITTAIDDKIEMYQYIPKARWKDFLGYIFKYADLKASFKEQKGIYSREAFDENSQMIFPRDYEIEYNKDIHGAVNIDSIVISDNSIQYLKNYKKFVEEKGANVYFIAPPVLDESIESNYEEFIELKDLEEKQIGIHYISNPIDYFFPRKYIYNSIYHCNEAGEHLRTELLIKDLKTILNNN